MSGGQAESRGGTQPSTVSCSGTSSPGCLSRTSQAVSSGCFGAVLSDRKGKNHISLFAVGLS